MTTPRVFWCDVCGRLVDRGCWIYYCHEFDYGTHLGCAIFDAGEASNKPSSNPANLGAEKPMETPIRALGGGGVLSRKDEEEEQALRKQVVDQMKDTELEIAWLQNQYASYIAQLMNWSHC
ncbi:uncharacterized protein LOC122070446 [Macadamia integrifolia]|uniref:uncharacterized protein LOC122070446 n=1 Tax=Macadamia integrifolia TaxID=60698 RepID=UPI001C4FD197|nr:uncharacterized protein LOC122070446 [Macadamia integrifolia]